MANLLAKGSRWLAQQQSRHAASDVEYRRGEAVIVVKAVKGQTQFDANESGVLTLESTLADFLIVVADLLLDGELIEPRAGDTIVHCGKTYAVTSEAGVKCWRYSDEYQVRYRVHTNLIAS